MRQVSIGPANLWRVLVQFCVLFPLVAQSQVLSDLAPASSRARNTVSGTVINAATGQPVRRALVRLNGTGEHLTFSDSSGQFEFDDLPPGQATVVVQKPGFFSNEELNQGRSGPTFLTIGRNSASLSLKLFPQGVIYGHVKDLEGEPIERVRVKAIMARIIEGRKRWQVLGSSSTNEDGEFRIARLAPGPYYIEAELQGNSQITGRRNEGYSPAFYPAAVDINSAIPFTIGFGQQADMELALRPAPLYKVSGVIAGYRPNTGVQIVFVDRLGNEFYGLRRFDRQTSQFEAEISAGTYILRALSWTPEGKQLRAETPLNVTRDITGIGLALSGSQPTPIIVTTQNRRPRTQTNDRERNPSNLVNLHLIPLEESLSAQEYWSTMQSSPKPSLVFPDVPPGTYSVEFQPSGSWYVYSAQCGSVDLLRDPLTVIAGVQVPSIDVVLRNDGATLRGRVRNAHKQTGATVILVSEHRSASQIKTTDVGPDGNFAITNLAPGSYTALAFDRSDTLEYTNPDVLAPYVLRGTPAALLPNGESQISLEPVQVAN